MVRLVQRLRPVILGLAAWGGAQPAAWAFGSSAARIWLPEAITTSAPMIDRLFYIVLAITGVAFVLVQAALLFFILRYRHRSGRPATYTHGNTTAEVIWTVVPALILVWLTCKSQSVWSFVRGTPPPPDLQIEITGEQFAWNVRYAGADGTLNTPDDITTINQLHLPVGQTVLFQIRSKDVIHSFFVPQFRMKQDAVPGLTTHLWVNPTKAGNYEIACAELCGLGHYRMRGFVVVETPEALAAWLAQQLAEQ